MKKKLKGAKFIPREYGKLLTSLPKNKVIFLLGPRQAGKTTFFHWLSENLFKGKKVRLMIGDFIETQRILSSKSLKLLKEFGYDLGVLLIDEVQYIPDVGATLKILIDSFPKLQIIATGSASLDTFTKSSEPLVGRRINIDFYPLSIYELRRNYYSSDFDLRQDLDDILIYGLYPEIFLSRSYKQKRVLLKQLIDAYLFKDILRLESVKYPQALYDLVYLLAYQIGQIVSINELSRELGVDVKTIKRYLWLLEKAFIIIPVGSFSRNLRSELKKSKKYYFTDIGVRNAIINDFTEFNKRSDKGQIWENFLFIERLKKLVLKQDIRNYYFWRTRARGLEIDLIEDKNGKVYAYEFKIKKNPKSQRTLKTFQTVYPGSLTKTIMRESFLNLVG